MFVVNLLRNLGVHQNGHRYDDDDIGYAFTLLTVLGKHNYHLLRGVCGGALPDVRTYVYLYLLNSSLAHPTNRIGRKIHFNLSPEREGWSLTCAPRAISTIIVSIMAYQRCDEDTARRLFEDNPTLYLHIDETAARSDVFLDPELGRITGLVTPIGKPWHAPLIVGASADNIRGAVKNSMLTDKIFLFKVSWSAST